jgi:hypothetical protein
MAAWRPGDIEPHWCEVVTDRDAMATSAVTMRPRSSQATAKEDQVLERFVQATSLSQ